MMAAKRSGTRPSSLLGIDDPDAAFAWDLILELVTMHDNVAERDRALKLSDGNVFPVVSIDREV